MCCLQESRIVALLELLGLTGYRLDPSRVIDLDRRRFTVRIIERCCGETIQGLDKTQRDLWQRIRANIDFPAVEDAFPYVPHNNLEL
ncbi:hypothetical protein YC2023_043957 [Brassica napus]